MKKEQVVQCLNRKLTKEHVHRAVIAHGGTIKSTKAASLRTLRKKQLEQVYLGTTVKVGDLKGKVKPSIIKKIAKHPVLIGAVAAVLGYTVGRKVGNKPVVEHKLNSIKPKEFIMSIQEQDKLQANLEKRAEELELDVTLVEQTPS